MMTMNRRSEKLGRSTHPGGGLHDLSGEHRDDRASRQADLPQTRPDLVQALALDVSVATVAKWRRRADPQDRSSRPQRQHKAMPPEAAPLLAWLRNDWLALRQTVFPQLSRAAVSRELVRLQLPRIQLLRPRPPRPQGRFRACPPGFIHIDTVALPRLGGSRRYLVVAIDRATRLMTMPVASARDMASAVAFLAHCQRCYPFHLHRVLTDNGREVTLRGYRGQSGAHTTKVYPFTGTASQRLYHPWTNGLGERTGGTIKADTVYRWHFESPALLDAGRYGFERYFTPLQSDGPQNVYTVEARMVSPSTQSISPTARRIVHNLVTLDS